MQTSKQTIGFNWQTIDKVCAYTALLGLFCVVGAFYLAPSYGEVARAFYVLMMLPALIALPYWIPRARLMSWSWLMFLLPIAYLAASNFWVDEQHINTDRSLWYFFKPFLFLILLLLAVQRVVGLVPRVDSYLVKFVTVVALISGIISLWQFLPTVVGKSWWPRMAGMSANHDINITGAMFGLNIVFCIYGLAKWSKGWRWLLLVSLLISLLIVLLGQSKVPLIYFIVSIIWLLAQGFRQRKYMTIIPVCFFLIMIAMAVLYYFERVPFLDRTTSYSDRFKLLGLAIEQAKLHWLFGYGVSSNIVIKFGVDDLHAHNILVDTLRYGGVVGALLLFAQMLFVAAKGVTLVRHNRHYLPLVAWFVLGVFFLLTNGQQPLVKPQYTWLFYWLPLVLIISKSLPIQSKPKDKITKSD